MVGKRPSHVSHHVLCACMLPQRAEATGVWSGDAIDSIERLVLVVRSGNEVFWRCISQWQIFEVVVVSMSSKNCWRLYNSYSTQPGGIGAPVHWVWIIFVLVRLAIRHGWLGWVCEWCFHAHVGVPPFYYSHGVGRREYYFRTSVQPTSGCSSSSPCTLVLCALYIPQLPTPSSR